MSALVYPRTLSNHELNPAMIQFKYFEREKIDDSSAGDVIQLYMPENTGQPSTVSWTTENIGYVGTQLMGEGGAYSGSEHLELMASRGMARMGSAAATLLGGNASADAMLGMAGLAANPYLMMLFKAVDFRTFSFQFKFAPFSESDCELIDNIIRTMRKNALPPGRGGAAQPAMLGYPNECEISYHWLGEENKWIHKFKRAVCTGIDIDYTSTGMFSVMRNGFPSHIGVTMKWSEIDIILRDDVEDGF